MRLIRSQKLRAASGYIPALLFIGFFLIYPTIETLGLSLRKQNGSGWTLEHFLRLFGSPVYAKVVLNSLYIAVVASVLSLLVAYPIAYLLMSMTREKRGLILIWVLIPLWTSFLIRGVAWMVILASHGLVNAFLMSVGVIDQPLKLINNQTGVFIGIVHSMVPIAVILILTSMGNIDPNLGRAAATMGAERGSVFWQVILPLTLPGVTAAFIIVFINSLGNYVAAQLLGGTREIMIGNLIIQQLEELFNLNFVSTLSLVLLAVTAVALLVFERTAGLSSLTGESPTGSTAGRKSAARTAGMWLAAQIGFAASGISRFFRNAFRRKWSVGAEGPSGLTIALSAVGLAFIALPVFVLIPASFFDASTLALPPPGYTGRWYYQALSSPLFQDALQRSIIVGLFTAALSMVLGIPAAFALSSADVHLKRTVLLIMIVPMVMPNIIIAIGVYIFYAKVGLLQTYVGLVLAHTIFGLPYVVLATMAAIRGYDRRLDQAAWSLGASKLRTFWRVSFPLMRAGMAAAFLFAFVQSFDELSVSLFVSSPARPTIAKYLWMEAVYRAGPSLAAVSIIMLLVVSLPIVVANLYRRGRRGPADDLPAPTSTT